MQRLVLRSAWLLLAAGLYVSPARAQTPVLAPPETPVGASSGTVGTPVWVNEPDLNYYWAVPGTEIADDLHLAEAGDIVSITFTILSGSPLPTTDVVVNFYVDDGSPVPGALLGSVTVPGLPTNIIWTQTVDLTTAITVPQDIWMGVTVPNGGSGQYSSWMLDYDPSLTLGPTVGTSTSRIYQFGYGPADYPGAYQHATVRIGEIVAEAEDLAFGVAPAPTAKAGKPWPSFSVELVDDQGDVVETASQPVTVSLAQGNGTLGGTLTRTPVNGVATFDNLSYNLAETIAIDVTAPDLTPITGTTVLVAPFVSNMRVAGADVSFTPLSPQVGESTQIDALVRNAGQEPATALVTFFRGDPNFGGVALGGSQQAPIPVGGTQLFSRSWLPTTDGQQSIFVVVDNLTPPEATPADNRTSRQIFVGAAAEELQIVGGQIDAWPGAQNSIAFTVNNVGAGPATITGASFGPPSWLTPITTLVGRTLQPGESLAALAQLDVPPDPLGAGDRPLIESIAIDLDTASGTFSGAFTAKLYDAPISTVTVRVEDQATHAALVGALVTARDLPGQFVTDGAGEVSLTLPPGSRDLFAYKQGYRAMAATYEVPEGNSSLVIGLEAGETLAVEQIVSEPLSTQEILDRGVDVNDPVNNHIVDFVVGMKIGEPLVLPSVEVPQVPQAPGTTYEFTGVAYPSGGGSGFGGGGGVLVSAQFRYHAYGHTETWILIPGEIWVLKSFFEVTTLVVNNAVAAAPEDVELQGASAQLTLPAGIGLPDLDGVPQSLTQALGTLGAGESAQATWVVRGDEPGSYSLTGQVAAELVAFGATPGTPLSATAVSNPFEVSVPSLRCEFITPGAVAKDVGFDFGVLITNTSAGPANLVRVTLRQEDLVNCRLADPQPLAVLNYDSYGVIVSATFTVGDLATAESGLATFRLLSDVTGVVLQKSVISGCGANPSPGVEAVPNPPVINQHPASQSQCAGLDVDFTVYAVGDGPLTYQWRKDGVDIPGATGATYTLVGVASGDAASYDVIVTNPGGSTPSAAADLTVNQLPTILAHPQDQEVATGTTVVLEVLASGVPAPTYQWRKDSTAIPGANGSALVLSDAQSADSGVYDVVVSNDCGSLTSNAALVTVNRPPEIFCNGSLELWSPNHELVDVSGAFSASDPDGDTVTLTVRVFSDESEVPETGDGTGKHAPDFKDELYEGGRGLLLRSERRGGEDGRWYVAVITADDGQGGVTQSVCAVAVCPHDQNKPESLDDVLTQAAVAAGQLQLALDSGSSLPPAGMYEHGLASPLGPKQ